MMVFQDEVGRDEMVIGSQTSIPASQQAKMSRRRLDRFHALRERLLTPDQIQRRTCIGLRNQNTGFDLDG